MLDGVSIRNLNSLNAAGHAFFAQGRFAEALGAFAKVRESAPSHPAPMVNEALCLRQLGRDREAIVLLEQAIHLDPQSMPALRTLAQLLLRVGRGSEAIPLLKRAAQLDPRAGTVLLGQALIEEGNFADAEALARRELDAEPDNGQFLELLGGVLKQTGRFDEAAQAFANAMLASPQRRSLALDYVSCRRMSEADRPKLNWILDSLQDLDLSSEESISVHFAIAKFYDDLKEYGLALKHFDEAHSEARAELSRKGQTYSAVQMQERFRAIADAFPKGRFARTSPGSSDSTRPLFILGMVRSGTTLVEQILTRHPQIASGGELAFWPENWQRLSLARASDSEADIRDLSRRYMALLHSVHPTLLMVTDKMPGNYIALGSIHSVFPKAKIIYCKREPIDNCVSIYTTPFRSGHNWIHRREDIVSFYRLHETLMEHWRQVLPPGVMHEVRYEELVSQPEPTTRSMIEFVGAGWNEACLTPEANARPVRTPSQWQVRQPIYRSSLGRWKNYEHGLGALSALLPERDREGS